MRKIILLVVSLTLVIFSASCKKDSDPTDPDGGNRTALNITSNPAGANIFIDDGSTGAITPAVIDVTGGSHKVDVTLCDYHDWTSTYYVNESQTVDVEATLALEFYFFDNFEDPVSSLDNWNLNSDSYIRQGYGRNGSRCIYLTGTYYPFTFRLEDLYRVPECLTSNHISFYYKFSYSGGYAEDATLCLNLTGITPITLNTTSDWVRMDITPSSAGEEIYIGFSITGDADWMFYLDDFQLSAE